MNVSCSRIISLSIALGMGLLMAMPAPVQAQDEGMIEEIIVTTRKKEENLQDIPIAVNAISREDMERAGVKELNEIANHDSSLQFDMGFTPADTRLVIRGLSPTRGRPNAATLIDGIDISSEAIGVAGGTLLINPRMLDVERVEIVKGPQSALYGRNAFAGAVQYVTRDPSDATEGEFTLDGAEEGYYSAKGSLSGPLGETAGFRLNALFWEEGGFYKNAITGNDIGGGEGLGLSATLKFEPNENSDYKLRVEYSDDEFEVMPQANIPFNGVNRVPAVASKCNGGIVNDGNCDGPAKYLQDFLLQTRAGDPNDPGVFDDMEHPAVQGNIPDADELVVTLTPDYRNGIGNEDLPGSTREVLRFSLVANWTLGQGTLTSLTGVANADSTSAMDIDKIAELGPEGYDITTASQILNIWSETNLLSQELRYVSEMEGPFNFAAGAQIWREDVEQNDRNHTIITNGTYCQISRVKFSPFVPARWTDSQGANPQFGLQANPDRYTCGYTSMPSAVVTQDVFNARQVTTAMRDTDHRSLYLALDFDFNESLAASVEARWTSESSDLTGPNTPVTMGRTESPGGVTICGSNGNCKPGASWGAHGPDGFGSAGAIATPITFTRSESYVTPKVGLQWRRSENTMMYGSWAVARKPGGFSSLTIGSFGMDGDGNGEPNEIEFESEKMQVWELGMKRTVLDGRMYLNGAYFFQDFTDKQISTQSIVGGQLGTVISNASGAKVHGLELDARWSIDDNWSLVGGYTWLKSEYTDYKVLSGGSPDFARIGNCNLVTVGGSTLCEVDRTGNELERSPRHSAQFTLAYQGPSTLRAGWDWFGSFSGVYQSERFVEDFNNKTLKSYWLANLQAGLASDNWELTLYVNNVFDDDTVRWAGGGPGMPVSDWRFGLTADIDLTQRPPAAGIGIIPSPRIATTVYGYLPPPRQFGLRFNYSF